MDFEPLHRGVYSVLVLVTTIFTTTVQGATLNPSNIPLQKTNVTSNDEVAISQVVTSDIPSFYELKVEKIAEEETSDIVQVLDEESGLKIDFVSAETPLTDKEVVQKLQEPLATPTPSPTPVPTPEPTKSPIKKAVLAAITPAPTPPTEEKSPSSEVAQAPAPAGSLNSDLILQMINDHRVKIGLTPFEKEARLCSIAESRRPQLHNEIFGSSYIHKGFRDLNLPFWITEDMAGYGSEQANFNWWMNSPLHRSAIEGNYKYSCGACDNVSCAQLFTSFVPK